MAHDQDLIDEVLQQEPTQYIQETEGGTASGFESGLTITKKGRKHLGMENKTEGRLNIFAENVASGARNVAGSIAATFGNTQFASLQDERVRQNLDLDEKTVKAGSFMEFLGTLGDWTAQSLGQAVPDVAGAIGAGVVTGGLGVPAVVGSGAFSFIRMQGSNYRAMRKWRPDADIGQVRVASLILSGVQAAIEQTGGLEAAGASKILGKRSVSEVAEDIVKSQQKNGRMNSMQKIILSSKNRAGSVAKGALSEFGEEVAQSASEIAIGSTWGKQTYTADELFQKLVLDPSRALPAGGIMGGTFHSANANGKSATGIAEVTQKEEESMFAIGDDAGKLILDEEAMAKDNASFDALQSELSPVLGSDAGAAVSQIKSLAYVLSFASQVNMGKDLKPADFINTLKVGFVDGDSTAADIQSINEIRNDGTLSQSEKGEKILQYVADAHGEDSKLYQTIKGVGQIVESSEIASATADILSTLERHAPEQTEEQAKAWRNDIGERVQRSQGVGAGTLLIPGRKSPRSMTYDDVGRLFTRDDVARIFLEEPIVQIADTDYAVLADNNGISFVEASEYDAEAKDVIGALLGDIEQKRDNVQPTGGAQMLAEEKAMHAAVEQKIFINEILDAFDSRQDPNSFSQSEIENARKKKQADESLSRVRDRLNSMVENGKYSDKERAAIQSRLDKSQEYLKEQQDKLIDYVDNFEGQRTSVNEASPIADQEERVASAGESIDQTTESLLEQFSQLQGEVAKDNAKIDKGNSAKTLEDGQTRFQQIVKDDDNWIIRKVETNDSVRYDVVDEDGKVVKSHTDLQAAMDQMQNPVDSKGRVVIKGKKKPNKKSVEEKKTLDEFNKEIAPLIDVLKEARADGDRMAVMQIAARINTMKADAGIEFSDGALFEVGDSLISNKPIGELTKDNIESDISKAGLIFSGFWGDDFGNMVTIVDPVGHSSFTVMDDQTIAEALSEHRKIQAKHLNEAPELATASSAGLFEQSPQTIRGMYIPSERTAIFFKGAGAQTVIHEFVHHAKSILPIDMQTSLLETFNEQNGRSAIGWTNEAEEWFANTMTKWIVNKQQPYDPADKSKAGAFLLARRIVMTAYKDFHLSEDTTAELDKMFGEVPDQAAVFGAGQAMKSMVSQQPPTADQVSELFAGRSGSRFDKKSDTASKMNGADDLEGSVRFDASVADSETNSTFSPDERKAALNKLHGITGSHENLRSLASEVFGDSFTSTKHLTDNEIAVLLQVADINSILNDSEMAKHANDAGSTLFEHARASGTETISERNRTADPRGVKFFNTLKNKLRGAGRVGMMTVSSMESMMKLLDNFSDTGVWHNLVYKPLIAAREVRASITMQKIKAFAESIKARNINMRKFQKQKMSLGGYDYHKGEVAFMAIVSRMRPQDIDSFLKSNFADNQELGRQLLEEANNFANNDTEMTGFIDSIQEAYKNIYDELNATYKDVTDNEEGMGKLEWYVPFIRTNEWDDLDSVMSKLNSVTAEGNEGYRSSTSRMQERQGGAGAKIDISDPFGQTVRYLNQASTYIAMAKTVKSVSATLSNENTRAALKWKYGEGVGKSTNWRFVHGVLKDLVAGELYHDARIKPMSEGEAIFRNWRTRYSMFALAGNVGTEVKQILSLPIGVARSGKPIETTLRAFGGILAITPRALMNATSNTLQFLSGNRQGADYKHILAGTEVYKNWSKYSQVLLNRHGNPETGEAQNYNFSGLFGFEISGLPLGETLMSGISAIDAVTVGTLWQSTFDAWVRSNKADGMSETDATLDAAEKANSMIRDSQPPSLPQDRNLLQRGSEYSRSFFMFTGATMRQYEVFATDILGRSAKALKSLKAGNVGAISDVLFKGNDLQSGLIMQLGIGFILPAVLAGMISRRRKPTERELIADIITYPFTAIPFARGILGHAAGVEVNGGEATSYIERAGKEVYDGITNATKAFYGNEWSGRNIQEAIDAITFLSHAPKVMGRVVSAGVINAIGEDDFLSSLKTEYVDPYDESVEL